jgi:hypothetical protein
MMASMSIMSMTLAMSYCMTALPVMLTVNVYDVSDVFDFMYCESCKTYLKGTKCSSTKEKMLGGSCDLRYIVNFQ